MIIKVQYFPEAEDEMDANAQEPKYVCYAKDEDEVDAFMGMIERNKIEEYI
jgi:hypothetical protein